MKTIPDEFIDAAWKTMAQCPQHTFLILTKRPRRMLKAMADIIIPNYGILPHVWLGVTVCNQQEADEKIPYLLKVPGKKWLSIEPMLGPVDIDQYLRCPICGYTPHDVGFHMDHRLCKGPGPGISAIVLGGETGPGARPLHPDWVRSVRDQCSAAGIDFFFKQWGEWAAIDWDNWLSRTACYVYMSGRVAEWDGAPIGHDPTGMVRVGRKTSGRLLDGKEHNDLPWGQ